MTQLANSRWFPFVDLLLAVASGALWYVAAGELSWQPLLLALLPWIIRLSLGRFPFRRTPLDLPILIFVLTAVVGLWAAYDRDAAWSKFWIIVGAILIYYALAGQRPAELWLVVGGWGACSAVFAAYFLLTHDWQAWPADVSFLNRLGRQWMAIRPSLSAPALHPNVAGGILAVLFPLLFAFGCHVWRKRRWVGVGIAAVSGAFTLAALLLSSSRAAWLALAVAMGIWILWEGSQRVGYLSRLSGRAIFASFFLLLGGLALWLVFSLAGGPLALVSNLPGPDSSTSRLALIRQTTDLVADFPITGGGLRAFAGLYSHYILVIPVFMFGYSHNLFLDVALEQGVGGILAFLLVLLGSVWLLLKGSAAPLDARQSGSGLFRWAVSAGLVTMGLHGVMDDALYGTLATPLLFLLPGLAIALHGFPPERRQPLFGLSIKQYLPLITALVLLLAGLFYIFRRPLTASWYANLGAVEMARIELKGWPTGEWDDGRNVAALAPAVARFEKALQSDGDNRTAQHHMGLAAMLERDYDTAVIHLEEAYSVDPAHRGIRKSLGYSYVWTGELDEAAVLLAEIPEAKEEMKVYTWWWRQQGREDLSARAAEMETWLDDTVTVRQQMNDP